MESDKSPSVVREYLEALLVAAIFLGFTNTFVLKTFYIPSGSMEDTLQIGDHLFVNRFVYGPRPSSMEENLLPGRSVRGGDIVIFRSPETPELDLVKRCVAVAGDRVEVIDKELFVNGEQVPDDAYAVNRHPQIISATSSLGREARSRDNFGPVTVPDDHLFCMGDNRDYSYDSRFFGPVPVSHVKGRAVMIYWSYGGATPDGTWRGWSARFKQLGNTVLGFLTKTRWRRTLKLIR